MTTTSPLQSLFKMMSPKTQNDDIAFINFLYQVFFGRDAEPIAVSTWTKYLADGHTYKDLFNALWVCDEFQTKAEQNPYIKKYIRPDSNELQARGADAIIDDNMFAELMSALAKDRNQLFEIPVVRGLVSQWRYRDLNGADNIKFLDGPTPDVLPQTAAYNELSLRSSVGFDRGVCVIYPLRSIGWIMENVETMKVLVVGARNEVELFALLSAGFKIENITMIDLISYSPFVEIGDMHDLRFADNTFDIVLLSHVLPYSAAPKKAAMELCRVTKHGGVVSYCDASIYTPGENLAPKELHVQAKPYASCAEVLDTFAPYSGEVIFRLEPRQPYTQMSARVGVTFVVEKNNVTKY